MIFGVQMAHSIDESWRIPLVGIHQSVYNHMQIPLLLDLGFVGVRHLLKCIYFPNFKLA